MLLQTLTFSGNINVSLQPGDIIYYSTPQSIGASGINTVGAATNVVTFGVCTAVFNEGSTTTVPVVPPHSIVVSYDNNTTLPPAVGDYIMFSKNKQVNSSGVKGYFAKVEFKNSSTEKAELFSIGSQVSESSK